MQIEASDDLTKIGVALPPGSHAAEEGLWAKPLGMGLFEVRNTPLLAYDLHWGDVVSCTEPEGERPQMVKVVHRSGHKTLRVLFAERCPRSQVRVTLDHLTDVGAMHWPGWQRYYAVDIPPIADYEAICVYLWEQEQEGLVQYETGMTRPYGQAISA